MESSKKFSRKQTFGFISERQEVEINIGNWDMTDLFGLFVPHGLLASEAKTIKIEGFWIRNDADDRYYHNPPEITIEMEGNNIELLRVAADKFDTIAFDTATEYNRGKLFFSYIPNISE